MSEDKKFLASLGKLYLAELVHKEKGEISNISKKFRKEFGYLLKA